MNPSDVHNLGGQIRTFRPNQARLQAQLYIAWGCIGLGSIGIGLGIFGLLTGEQTDILIISILGLFIAASGLFLLRRAQPKNGWLIVVYEEGLAYYHKGQYGQFRWESVAAVWQRIAQDTETSRLTAIYKIMLLDDSIVRFDASYQGILQLGKIIHTETAKLKGPAFWQAYQAQRTLPFGKIKLTHQGIEHKGKTLEWSSIETVSFSRHLATIYKKDKRLGWATLNIPEIPNIFVLTQLLSRILAKDIDTSDLN